MTSIYQRALGPDFERLHPRMQERFGFSSADAVAHIGTGVMERMTRGSFLTVPFLRFGSRRNLLFPEHGTQVPFTVANYAYIDDFGRETITWDRTFEFVGRRRRFDAQMIWSEERNVIVDYLGTHQHVAADLHCWVDEDGGINFRSGEQRLYEGPLRFRMPRRLTGHARVREWWDDEAERFRIRVDVHNPILGHIVGYRGSFSDVTIPIDGQRQIPVGAVPCRQQEQE
ncbi:MAG: DUF4166 domain-containing protein [Actinomycetota bacterium]